MVAITDILPSHEVYVERKARTAGLFPWTRLETVVRKPETPVLRSNDSGLAAQRLVESMTMRGAILRKPYRSAHLQARSRLHQAIAQSFPTLGRDPLPHSSSRQLPVP